MQEAFLSGLVLMVDEGSPAMQLAAARLLAQLASDIAACKAICQVIYSPACLHLELSLPQTSARAAAVLSGEMRFHRAWHVFLMSAGARMYRVLYTQDG